MLMRLLLLAVKNVKTWTWLLEELLEKKWRHDKDKKAVKFDNKCTDWCTYQNLQEMYGSAGIACKHPEPLWRDENDKVVTEENAYGLASQYELIHHDWLFFVDEYGSNISQTKDGQVDGSCFFAVRMAGHNNVLPPRMHTNCP
jgi:hypothetical protein